MPVGWKETPRQDWQLFGVEINVTERPAATGNGAFDTMGANVFIAGNQLEQCLTLGCEALDDSFEWQAAIGLERQIRVEAEEEASQKVRKKHQADLDALERAKKWVAAVGAAMASQEIAEVVAKLRKDAKGEDAVRRGWEKITGAPAPGDFGLVT
jgi:hypothetical protein